MHLKLKVDYNTKNHFLNLLIFLTTHSTPELTV